jgi:hypothetical protein
MMAGNRPGRFLASLSVDRMRYPRFILVDSMEDKGIEERRAQNFQKFLLMDLKLFLQILINLYL